jgi:hypothetical protein
LCDMEVLPRMHLNSACRKGPPRGVLLTLIFSLSVGWVGDRSARAQVQPGKIRQVKSSVLTLGKFLMVGKPQQLTNKEGSI